MILDLVYIWVFFFFTWWIFNLTESVCFTAVLPEGLKIQDSSRVSGLQSRAVL